MAADLPEKVREEHCQLTPCRTKGRKAVQRCSGRVDSMRFVDIESDNFFLKFCVIANEGA